MTYYLARSRCQLLFKLLWIGPALFQILKCRKLFSNFSYLLFSTFTSQTMFFLLLHQLSLIQPLWFCILYVLPKNQPSSSTISLDILSSYTKLPYWIGGGTIATILSKVTFWTCFPCTSTQGCETSSLDASHSCSLIVTLHPQLTLSCSELSCWYR